MILPQSRNQKINDDFSCACGQSQYVPVWKRCQRKTHQPKLVYNFVLCSLRCFSSEFANTSKALFPVPEGPRTAPSFHGGKRSTWRRQTSARWIVIKRWQSNFGHKDLDDSKLERLKDRRIWAILPHIHSVSGSATLQLLQDLSETHHDLSATTWGL